VRRILVVDDEPKITALVDSILTRNGYQVLTADSSSEAFAIVSREPVDLVVSDINMPGLRGPDLLAYLSARGIHPPVLFISGDLEVQNVEQALDVPRAAFLPKPFTPAELLAAVAGSLRSA